jgi:purine-nucleoside phosphorylase/nicotinic acid mononucleotide adenylyltransferase
MEKEQQIHTISEWSEVIDNITQAVTTDIDGSMLGVEEPETIKLLQEIRGGLLEALGSIKEHSQKGELFIDTPLRLSVSDAPVRIRQGFTPDRRWRVGFMATTGDPLHWGHIMAALRAAAVNNLDTVIVQIMGDHPHKRMQKQPKEHRHAIARLALQYFHPLLRYSPLGFDNLKVGEENAAEFLLLNFDLPIDLFFIVGGDASPDALRNLRACNDLLSFAQKEFGKTLQICALLNLSEGEFSNVPEKDEWLSNQENSCSARLVYKDMELSSTLYRNCPHLPLLPCEAIRYIEQHGLYKVKWLITKEFPVLESTVILSYLTPGLHRLLEHRLEDVVEIPPLIPHAEPGKSGFMGGRRISLFRGAGKETSILPAMKKEEVERVFAIGLCGALQTKLSLGDIVLPTCALRGEGVTAYWADPRLPALVDNDLLECLKGAASRTNCTPVVGPVYTTASLVQERGVLQKFAPLGILAVEMELAMHLTLAMLHGKPAAAIYIVSDNVALGENIVDSGINESERIRKAVFWAGAILGEEGGSHACKSF